MTLHLGHLGFMPSWVVTAIIGVPTSIWASKVLSGPRPVTKIVSTPGAEYCNIQISIGNWKKREMGIRFAV